MNWLQRPPLFDAPLQLPEERYPWSWSGIVNPVKNAVDDVFRDFTGLLEQASARTRARTRDAVTYEYSDTLTEFAQRAAVFALRDEDRAWITHGMTALGMSESDIRDMDRTLKLLLHAAVRSGVAVDPLLESAAALSHGEHQKYFRAHLGKSDRFREPQAIHRFELQTPGGIGFAHLGSERYAPSHDLAEMIVELAEKVTDDKYLLRSVEIGAKVPVDQRYSGSASLEASLMTTDDPGEKWRHDLQIHLAEIVDEGGARKLRAAVGKMKPQSHSVLTAYAEENLFCLVAAMSRVQHLEVIETPTTLERFSDAAAELFRRSLTQGNRDL